ncbi:MAG: hypothetical protein RL440_1866 [Bacteroidota bacterium]|jgi:hypothetical protein
MKLLKELIWSLPLLLVLYASYVLAPFLELPQTKTAQVPVFQDQAFCFSVLPLQVVQSWVLEQQLESKDVAVQEALKQMSLHFKTERNTTLADFQFDLHGALAYYLIENPKQAFSCIFIPGSGQKEGWLSAQYYGVQKGIFFFAEPLKVKQRTYFEKSLVKMRFQTKKFEARKHHFELKGQPYTLLWEEHAFALELPEEAKQQTLMLAPNGFHLSCPLALSNLPASFHFLESIKASSLNYYGAQLNNKQALVLDFEALLTFDNQNARTAFLNSCQNAFPDWQWAPNFVRVNEAVYALKKEGDKQLFICSKPKQHIQNGKFAQRTSTLPIACSGNPTLLTKLDNAGWAAAILELFPIYRGISDFSARTANVSTTNNTIRWELKEDYFAAGEFLKLLGTTLDQ